MMQTILADRRASQELIEQRDAAIVKTQDYRTSIAFAFGCMTAEQREMFNLYHRPNLVEHRDYLYCSDEQSIIAFGHLKAAVKYIKTILSDADIRMLKHEFQFYIAEIDYDSEEVAGRTFDA
ncbi:hypothetical protein VPHF86_0172 [Vibrio phage F86]